MKPSALRLGAMLLAAAPLPAAAQVVDDDAELVRVRPGPRLYFHGDQHEGPGPRRAAYVVAGDTLVAGEVRGKLRLATYVPAGGGRHTTGWVDSASLTAAAPPAPRPEAWIGDWTGWHQRIDITRAKRPGALHLSGEATWGMHDKARVARGAINFGDFDEEARPAGDRIEFGAPDDCAVSLRLLGPYLLAVDNGRCGGLNVSFSGVYRR